MRSIVWLLLLAVVAVVGATARRQAAYDGTQPGDPARAAQAILAIAAMDEPPLRIALGSDAVAIIREISHNRSETCRDISSTGQRTRIRRASSTWN